MSPESLSPEALSPENLVIFDTVRDILMTHTKTGTVITPEMQIGADLAIDSVEMFDLVMEIEEVYDFSFPLEEASAIDTVQALVEAIGKRRNG